MKPKYQTRANRAEEQVLAMLKTEKNIQKPWSLVAHTLENRTLQTTAPEAAIIFNHDASLRPGYEQKDDKVYVPNLFIKLSGKDETFSAFQNRQELQKRENCFVYDSFKSFAQSDISEHHYESYLEDGLLKKDEFLSSDAFNYSFLRREYQELYVDKVNEILSSKKDFFIGQGLNLTDNQILSNLCQINESFFHAFHQFDFQFQPPAVIITNKGKERPNINQALTLILLNQLGFDVVIHSPDGHSDIENILNPDVYCLFYGDGLKYKNPGRRLVYRLRYIAAGVIIAAVITAGSLLKPALSTLYEAPPIKPEKNITEIEPPDKPVIDQPPSDDFVGTAKPIVFNDPGVEQGLRKLVEKLNGDIYPGEIAKLSSIRFVGPYMGGGPDWTFINGYSSDAYYDVNNKAYTEEGDINDLSVFVQIPHINQLEISFQKGIKLDSLKGVTVSSLVLIHNHITDISPLGDVKGIGHLDLACNNISDISPLEGMAINSLDIRFNNVSNIEPLTKMTNLSYLDLDSNPVKDISPLYKLTGMRGLHLINVQAKDFGFLKKMPGLEDLSLSATGFTDVSFIEDLTNLKSLYLSNNNISDISYLRNLKHLQYLDISFTDVRDISVLKELPELKTLTMFGVTLDDVSIFEELKKLEIRR